MACRAITIRESTTLVITTTVGGTTWLATAIFLRCMEYFNADNPEFEARHAALGRVIYIMLSIVCYMCRLIQQWYRKPRDIQPGNQQHWQLQSRQSECWQLQPRWNCACSQTAKIEPSGYLARLAAINSFLQAHITVESWMLAIRTAVLAILAMPTMVRLLAEADALTCLDLLADCRPAACLCCHF